MTTPVTQDPHSQAAVLPGVALGLGLMSWILNEAEGEPEPISATGKIVKDAVSGEVVEIYVSLREVRLSGWLVSVMVFSLFCRPVPLRISST